MSANVGNGVPPEPGPEKKGVAEVFQQVWEQALASVTSAEEEVSKLVTKLQASAGWSSDEAIKQVAKFTERLTAQRQEVEKRVEAMVGQSLEALRVPRREEIAKLSARIDALTERVESLTK